ncbi:DUF1294 domain-containing protein [Shouchella shacheensis]|uniref:DUF1294 domain-containing protein n=1 Tax=Shouchella shacheensis TaxID=1649580 RepID=UPI001FE11192|nr:DUF1294 domain-containing protein [Shouchella shacheensis]
MLEAASMCPHEGYEERRRWSLLLYLLLLNLLGFLVMGLDKKRARAGAYRFPETLLLAIAFTGGTVGVYMGMYTFRHKTRKRLFSVGIPCLVLAQIGGGLFIFF